MALDLSQTLQALLNGQHLNLPLLFYFDFASGAKRYWLGPADIVLGGVTWIGKPIMVGVAWGNMSINGAAENFRLSVSGVDQDWLSKVSAEESECLGRSVQLFFQFFDDNWLPLDQPWLVRSGTMQSLRYDDSATQRGITVECESIFIARGYPPLTYLSDAEQQRRFPGDMGLSRILTIQGSSSVQWPTFFS